MRLNKLLLLILLPLMLLAQNNKAIIQVGSFNMEWFPCKDDGNMMIKYGITLRNLPHGNHTDIPAVFNLLKQLDIELLGVVEIVDPQVLQDSARKYLGDQYKVIYAPSPGSQKVGFLYDSSVLELKDKPQVYYDVALKPDSWLRPAFRAYFKYKPNGFDFHAIICHLKAGPNGWKIRKKQWQALQNILSDLQKNSGDKDIVVMGDFNNVSKLGYNEFLPVIKKLHFDWATGLLAQEHLYSNYWQPHYDEEYIKGSLIDQIFISRDAEQEYIPKSIEVGGACAKGAPEYKGAAIPAYFKKISDHCPVFVSFRADIDND
jgi:hypothetical protein